MNILGIYGGFPYSHTDDTIVGSAQEYTLGFQTIENIVHNLKKMI